MSYFAFLTCQDFYISCEQVFNPDLEGKPCVILSHKGNVIALSKEAEELKISMGSPYLEIKEFCSFNQIKILPPNYKLYGNLFQRALDIIVEMGLEIEVYSMDAVFVKFAEDISVESVESLCGEIRQRVKKWVGLSMTIGVAPTKILAKIAHNKSIESGFFSLCCSYERQSVLETFPIESVWGMENINPADLFHLNIQTAQQFCDQEPVLIRRHFGVAVERVLWELRGLSCLVMSEIPGSKEAVTYSISFNRKITDCDELSESLFASVNTASLKLKQQKNLAQGICVFVESINDSGRRRYYSYAATLSEATDEANLIVVQAQHCLQKIYQKKEIYKKCGVVLTDLLQKDAETKIFAEPCPKRSHFMNAMNSIEEYFGNDSVHISQKSTRNEWKTRSDKRAGQYINRSPGMAFVKA